MITITEIESIFDISLTSIDNLTDNQIEDFMVALNTLGSKEKIEVIKSSGLNFGSNISEYTAWMLERSIKTLKIRVNAQNDNALNLAKFLSEHNFVSKVFYPGLENHKNHDIAKIQMHGFGGCLLYTSPSPRD